MRSRCFVEVGNQASTEERIAFCRFLARFEPPIWHNTHRNIGLHMCIYTA
ncbi:hypothetical protein COLSTE_01180 [Collinsella stercoris DSM 13279]|uniref:Uncharacterized protein n=1 Tax=Collinsella stercoris DSM 13279 TaxID=445975 RepID=B6GAT0_9ACTN|nr:hypothetical protein COLSTE_01180 [Collinsella stercoris DSM 13279]